VFEPPLPQDPSNRCPDLTIARRILPGWSCGISYEDGIRRTIEWFRTKLTAADRLASANAG
jgi:nucleoside-diphosphate-sugar epimerase